LPALLQDRIARSLDDETVKRDVVAHERGDIAATSGLPHRLDLRLECAHVARELLRRLLRRKLLEHRADGIDLDELRVPECSDPGALEGLGLDEAQQLQV